MTGYKIGSSALWVGTTALGSLLLLGSVLLAPLKPRPPQIDAASLDLPAMAPLIERHLPLTIHNPNWTTIRIVGCQGNGCGPGGCVYGVEPDTFDLAPGETKEILVHYKSPPVPGPFEKEFIIYSATDTLNEHKLKVTGVAVAAKKESHHEDSKDTKKNTKEKSDVSQSKS